jgi:NADPH:quinone reductase-like Zn-dependent oxidoreductase
MRALVLLRHGGIENLEERDLPAPELSAPDQVLIRVRTAAINHLDLFLTEGIKGITPSFPHIVGTDGAGVVERVGAAVTRFHPGDRVAVNPGISCGSCEACAGGEDPLCRSYQILGEHRSGTAAELIVVPERNVATIPPDMPWATAAALPLSTLTAWRMLVTRARLERGETVLIWGIGGGVASAALAIARHLGARIIATSSSDRKLERARDMGADVVYNHASRTPDDIARAVRKLTGPGADVVVDTVGRATWDASLKSLRPMGRLVTCGATSGPEVGLDIRRLFWFQWSILGSTMGSRAEFAEVMRLAHQGKLWPVVDSVVPLERGAEAYRRMQRGEQLGKLVIEVSQ